MDRVLPSGTVTLLFTDIEGSTRLLESLGEEYGAVLAEHHRLLRAVWGEHGGVEVDTEGDAFFVAFDEATAAVHAAVDAQRRLAAHDWPSGHAVRVRMAVHTGSPRVQGGTYWGSDVHYAARLASAAHGGQLLASETTQPLAHDCVFESLGEHALKDFTRPREVFHVVIDGLRANAFPALQTLSQAHTNLPTPAGALVGRQQEIAELIGYCTDGESLVTIVGPGGSGKTRLAVELGHRVTERFEGVWFVALAEVTKPDEVVGAVARILGLPELPGVDELERVTNYIRRRSLLLVLDNLEHVLQAAPLVSRLALAGEGVRVLATSQAPLRLGGECVFRLSPLSLPADSERNLEALAEVPAVALLLQRAHAAGSGLGLSEENAADIGRLCRQLEGMPLALELAAARLHLLGPGGLCRRLEQELDALGRGSRDLPPRQRGLRAVLEWTTRLLEDDESQLLSNLSVCAGGFTLELAEAAFGDVLEGLMTLLDVGLIRRDESDRLSLRPPVRRFAGEQLVAIGVEAAAQRALADALAQLGERFERRWFLVAVEGRRLLNPEAANITAALDWTREHDPLRHARLAAATGWWMNHSARAESSRAHLTLALERVNDVKLRARCLQALGALGLASLDPAPSLQAADAWRELGDSDGEVMSLLYAANLCGLSRDGAGAMEIVERASARLLTAPPDDGLSWMLEAVRADALSLLGRHAEAEALIGRLLADTPPRTWKRFWAATKSADIALNAGRPADALALYGHALQDLQTVVSATGELMLEVMVTDTIAPALLHLGRVEEAARTLAISELVHTELSWPPVGLFATSLDEVRDRLDDQERASAERHAKTLGVRRGLDWIGAVARGEETAPGSADRR